MCKVWINYYEVNLYVSPPQSGGERQGNTRTYEWKNRQMYLIVQTSSPLVLETTHPIGLEFSWIRKKSDF